MVYDECNIPILKQTDKYKIAWIFNMNNKHSPQQIPGHKSQGVIAFLHKFQDNVLPHFTDIFDEEGFLVFAFFFVLASVMIIFLLSKCVKLKSYDPIDTIQMINRKRKHE